MPPTLATVIIIFGIAGLFWLDRDTSGSTSKALWVPVLWLSIACSRPVNEWLQMGTPRPAADQLLEGSPIDRLVYTGLLAAGLVVLASRKGRVAKLLRANGAILVFFLYCTMSLL